MARAGAKPSAARLWLSVVPLPFYHATILPVLLGSFLAAGAVPLDLRLLALTLLGGLLFHTQAALYNEYFDYRSGADRVVTHRNPFAGGSRVLTLREGGLSPRSVLAAALALSAAGIAIGLSLAWTRGAPLLLVGGLGVGCVVFYSAPPLRLSHRGLGELAAGAGFGPLMALGAYFVQAQRLDPGVVLASLPLGLHTASILLFDEFPDYEGDRKTGKRNLVVRLGLDRAVGLTFVVVLLAYGSLVLNVAHGTLPPPALAALLAAPVHGAAFRILARRRGDPDGLAPGNGLMLAAHLGLGSLLLLPLLE